MASLLVLTFLYVQIGEPKYDVLFHLCKHYCRCNDVYIGETKRHILVRQFEHIGKSILTEKPLKYNEKDATAIRKHCHHKDHRADINCFSLIGSASNKFHLKLKESLLILKMKPSLNIAKESMPLMLFDHVT